MPIRIGLLPERVNVARVPKQVGDTGDTSSGPVLVGEPVAIRITRNKGTSSLGVGGVVANSSHVGFTLPTADVSIDDILTQTATGEVFIVRFVDGRPGGVRGHHQQVYMDCYGEGGYS